MQSRTDTLESRVVHGPVVFLIGGRLTTERPGPRRSRRSPNIDDTPFAA